jgi:hypothetical protein
MRHDRYARIGSRCDCGESMVALVSFFSSQRTQNAIDTQTHSAIRYLVATSYPRREKVTAGQASGWKVEAYQTLTIIDAAFVALSSALYLKAVSRTGCTIAGWRLVAYAQRFIRRMRSTSTLVYFERIAAESS